MHKTERWVLFPYLAMDYKAAEDWLNQQARAGWRVASFDLRGWTVYLLPADPVSYTHLSGCDVCVGLRQGSKNWANAEKAGLTVKTVPEAAKWADIVMILINDEVQADVYKKDIAPYLEEGNALAFAHGFNIRYQQIVPPAGVDVFMAAFTAPAATPLIMYFWQEI